MHLSSCLSSASPLVANGGVLAGFRNGSNAKSLPGLIIPRRTLTSRKALSSSLVPRKSVAAISAARSAFQSGQSVGKGRQFFNGSLWSAVWLDNTAEVETEVPIDVAWDLWSDREGVNRWMPWIDNVKVLEDQPELSRWTLKYAMFGQKWEFSWIARNMKPVFHQKIHWRSVDGLPNRGTVRFYPRSPDKTGVQLTISYELPAVLGGLGAAVAPIVEGILRSDLDRFAKFAKSYQLESQRK